MYEKALKTGEFLPQKLGLLFFCPWYLIKYYVDIWQVLANYVMIRAKESIKERGVAYEGKPAKHVLCDEGDYYGGKKHAAH